MLAGKMHLATAPAPLRLSPRNWKARRRFS